MNTIPFMLMAILGWGLLGWKVNEDIQDAKPVQSIDCSQMQYERDSLRKTLDVITGAKDMKLP